MGRYIPRTCAEDQQDGPTCLVSAFRRSDFAYVLLGEPGAGKTECFKKEAVESDSVFIPARKFVQTTAFSALKGRTLFIDGLDEMRAGGGDGRIPIEKICAKLDELGRPPFRISCREADWLGAIDQQELIGVAPSKSLKILRLQPLTDDEIYFLVSDKLAEQSKEFIDHAKIVGLYDLLPNPQNLNILLAAVQKGVWPSSRKEAYELACQYLVQEQNPGHQLARGVELPHAENLLDAAGLLAACHLLGNYSGYTLLPAKADDLNPAVKDINWPVPLQFNDTIKSALFKDDGAGHRIPHHRSTAEFLAARYLASLIDRPNDALPWYRLLALIAASDGKPVASLRGLWAWIATFLDDQKRLHLVANDPVAVALYGDVRTWPTEDKTYLLQSLYNAAQRLPWIFGNIWTLSPLGALATPDMVPTFKRILTSSVRDEAQQVLVDCVLQAVQYGERLCDLTCVIEAVVRDASRWDRIRKTALQALLHLSPSGGPPTSAVFSILSDLQSNAVIDRDDELLGVLLTNLYPTYLAADQVFDYLHPEKDKQLIGYYHMFWARGLVKKSITEPSTIPILLDQVVGRVEKLHDEDAGPSRPLFDIVGPLLIQGLLRYGDQISSSRLYAWLGSGQNRHALWQVREHGNEIQEWLNERPQRCKDVLSEGIAHAPIGSDELKGYFNYHWYQRLYGAKLPLDLGHWILTQLENLDFDVGVALFPQALRCLWSGQVEGKFSLESVDLWVDRFPAYRPALENELQCTIPEWHRTQTQEALKWRRENERLRAETAQFFASQQQALENGTASLKTLDDLSIAYRGLSSDVQGETPHDRIRDLICGSKGDDSDSLLQSALTALKKCLDSPTLPSTENVLQIAVTGKVHYLSGPCLAAAEEVATENGGTLPTRYQAIFRQLVAMQLTHGLGQDAQWYRALKQSMPRLVVDVFCNYALIMLNSGKSSVNGLYEITHDEEEAAIASVAVPRLLKQFPRACPDNQLSYLKYLLVAGFRYLPAEKMLSITSKKLRIEVVEKNQRTLWLLAAFLLNHLQYHLQLADHIDKYPDQAVVVADFFSDRGDEWPFGNLQMQADVIGWLIALLGSRSKPYSFKNGADRVPAHSIADQVSTWITSLGNMPSEEASMVLQMLLARHELNAWFNDIRIAAHGQATVQREAKFSYSTLSQILHTLSNRQPANAADLAALTLDHLNSLARSIRDEANNEFTHYWSYDEGNRKLRQPKPENDCRDLLLTRLQGQLRPHRAKALKEGYFVEDKRADIIVIHRDYLIPIEIKKDSHADIWTALQDQLVKQYTRDPKTGGYGIYLVFWFGGQGMKRSPNGCRPQNAQEMKQWLLDLLDPTLRNLISICVIDCMLPHTESESRRAMTRRKPVSGAKRLPAV